MYWNYLINGVTGEELTGRLFWVENRICCVSNRKEETLAPFLFIPASITKLHVWFCLSARYLVHQIISTASFTSPLPSPGSSATELRELFQNLCDPSAVPATLTYRSTMLNHKIAHLTTIETPCYDLRGSSCAWQQLLYLTWCPETDRMWCCFNQWMMLHIFRLSLLEDIHPVEMYVYMNSDRNSCVRNESRELERKVPHPFSAHVHIMIHNTMKKAFKLRQIIES